MSLSIDKLTPDEQAKVGLLVDTLRAATLDRRVTWGRRATKHGIDDDEFSIELKSGLMVCVRRRAFEVFSDSGRRVIDLVLRDDALWEVVQATHDEYLDHLIEKIMEDLK